MLLRFGYDLQFEQSAPVPMMLLLSTYPCQSLFFRQPELLQIEPTVTCTEYYDSFGNRCHRLTAPVGRLHLRNSFVIEHSGEPETADWDAIQHLLEDLPSETLCFLLASRYCEVELLSDIAWQLFGHFAPGWSRVQAICDWVHENVRYDGDSTHPTKTACDVYKDRGGVCRDFQHLAITFCRALNIPARYVSGYLTEVGITSDGRPMDFHAWFEAYLGGKWHTFDARHNRPRTGRVAMAHGRDAVDVALTTSFGVIDLVYFEVTAEAIAILE